MIDPNVHSCGAVPPHGERDLAHPEPGFYLAGAKSYGRAPTFLMATGYEQIRSITAALAGDHHTADTIQLDLPQTGVCTTDPPTEDQLLDGQAGSCCGTSAPEPVGIGFGTPPGLGFATGSEHGYSGAAETADA